MAQQRSRGRPSTAVVTREKIAEAALGVVAEAGYDKLTMAAVARRLGVGSSALYNHVSGKEELLFLVEDAVMAQVDTSALRACLTGTTAPGDALAAWARSYRDVFAIHAPLIAQIATMPIWGTRETVEMYELVAQVILSGGVPDDRVMDAVVALEAFIFGSAYDVGAPAHIFDVPAEASPAVAPHLRRALAHREGAAPPAEGTNPYADAPFELGLRVLIDGLLAH
ncbi:TetR/AcrR family transcriptional regulator [Corynebacterium qintianiae]|uniref:TetR/AcrR family transcriptional regulator n=1 Tax=Corynebacterium qintianiae TaxID=2709392 RepID=UPI0013EBE85F|nr:TetR/AcrR family transcriptional regulator [Corynebacterium qintianiae]